MVRKKHPKSVWTAERWATKISGSRRDVQSKPDNTKLVKAVRAEIERRTKRLEKARKAIRKPTRKLNRSERAKLHKLAFTAEQVRRECL
jgi:hypothetical protein